jgi:hypothetical protein
MPAPAIPAHTYAEYASSFGLWGEYIDPDGTFSEEEFEAMGYEGRLNLLIKEFGPEEHEPTDAEISEVIGFCSF